MDPPLGSDQAQPQLRDQRQGEFVLYVEMNTDQERLHHRATSPKSSQGQVQHVYTSRRSAPCGIITNPV